MQTNQPSKEPHFDPIRFYGVDGFEDRKNDVVYGRPVSPKSDASVVVFFPGDVQDYTENMESHRDNKHHKQWNLESTVEILQKKFPDCHVLLIKPSKMGLKTFSCFENFVKCNQIGVPEHVANNNALRHLNCLIENLSDRLKSCDNSTNREVESENIHPMMSNSKLILLGFSKGCVVLNQLLYEFHENGSSRNQEFQNIVSKIEDLYWLDGGHAGGKNTWVTDKNVLQTLCALGINVHVHVTPYQIRDDRRPWIKSEEKAFSEYLLKHGCKIRREVHFESAPPSINIHFDVINTFKK